MKKIIGIFALFFALAFTSYGQNPKLLTAHPWKVDPVAIDEQIALAGEDSDAVATLEKMKNLVYTFSTKKKVNKVKIDNIGEGTWSLEGRNLIINISSGVQKYRITELTGARLSFIPDGMSNEIKLVSQ
jgi:beta-lactam-binding protein with PASTA domain